MTTQPPSQVLSQSVHTLPSMYLPSAQALLGFGSIAWADMALAVGFGLGLLFLLEACKPMVRRLLAQPTRVRVSEGAVAR